MSQIQKIEQFRKELALAETYEDIKALDAKASAIAEFARRNRVSKQKQDELGEFRIEIEAKKGAWLDEFFPHGNEKGVNNRESVSSNNSSLQNIGVTYDESANARLISKEQEIVRDVVEQLKKDENKVVTPFAVQREVRKIKKEEELQNKKKDYKQKIEVRPDKVSIDIYNTDNKYRIIYADPAWSYNDIQDTSNLGGAAKHYNTMTTSQICDLPISNISQKDSVLFLWVTSPLLEDGMRVIKEWGFKYKSSFVWDKIKHNMGHYNSVRHEFLLIATKGSCVPDNKKLYDSVQSIEKTNKHSQKPKEFLDIIDDIYTYGDRIELFARESYSSAWDVWGNEV